LKRYPYTYRLEGMIEVEAERLEVGGTLEVGGGKVGGKKRG
jgi:hypothetical protein